MLIRRLTLHQFRNYDAASLEAGTGLIALAGENGAGKTNILEAISLLAPGRGLRRAPLPEMLRQEGGQTNNRGFAVNADLASTPDGGAPVNIGTGVEAANPTRRIVKVNGAVQSANALGEWLALLWLTPAMDRIFVESAGTRRRFLDRLVLALHPSHAAHATRYEAAMRARTKLLAEATEGKAPDPQWLTALEAQMAVHGAAIDAARIDLVDALGAALALLPDAPFARPLLALADPQAGDKDKMRWTEDRLRTALERGRGVDMRAGRALYGPHRSDLIVIHAAKNQPADRCSTGEQKALLLSIVLAHGDLVAGRRGMRPILLMDELAAHLDPIRRAALYDRLASTGGQVWMTGTEMALFENAPAPIARFHVREGRIEPLL